MSNFLIVDANSIASRGFYIYADEFYKMIDRVIADINATHVVFCFDNKESWRKTLYVEYKGKRKSNPERNLYINRVKQSLDEAGFQTFTLTGYEADDLCASFVNQSPALNTYVLSGDKDLLQLVSDNDNVQVINFRSKFGNRKIYDESLFMREFGFLPKNYRTYKSLVGDSSDNIPGVKGIGKVSGTKLVQKFKTLESLYDCLVDVIPSVAKKLYNDKNNAYLAYKLVGLSVQTIEFDYDLCLVKDLKKAKWLLIQQLKNSQK